MQFQLLSPLFHSPNHKFLSSDLMRNVTFAIPGAPFLFLPTSGREATMLAPIPPLYHPSPNALNYHPLPSKIIPVSTLVVANFRFSITSLLDMLSLL